MRLMVRQRGVERVCGTRKKCCTTRFERGAARVDII